MVGDVHGAVDPEVLERFYPMFDTYIIHTTTSELDRAKSMVDRIKEVKLNPKILFKKKEEEAEQAKAKDKD